MPASDHDLLIRVNESIVSLRDEVRQINQAHSQSIADHEARIRVLESGLQANSSADATKDKVKGNNIAILVAVATCISSLATLALVFVTR